VQSAIDGYQVCVMSYGQTCSGKTYTMQGGLATGGGGGDQGGNCNGGGGKNDSICRGIIPRALRKVLSEVQRRSAAGDGWAYAASVSLYEIYGDQLRDLMRAPPAAASGGAGAAAAADAPPKLEVRPSKKKGGGVEIAGLTSLRVENEAQAEEALAAALSRRAVAATEMNAGSSRAHTIFVLDLAGTHAAKGVSVRGRLNLCDLAGSERVERSGATGERLKEAIAINKSLTTLASVFDAIRTKAAHVPFRDSKLTQCLRDCLSGDGKTMMLINLSPSENDRSETLSTLRFAHSVRQCEMGKPRRQVSAVTAAAAEDATVDATAAEGTPRKARATAVRMRSTPVRVACGSPARTRAVGAASRGTPKKAESARKGKPTSLLRPRTRIAARSSNNGDEV